MLALAAQPTRIQNWTPSGPRQPNHVTVADYLGTQGRLGSGPQIFSADLTNADCVVDPHFHRVDQFQVFWRGTGQLGREPIAPVAVHFARAYTTYGPIRGGADGIAYVTVRARHEDTGFWMPESVAERPRGVRRQMMTAQLPNGDARLFGDDTAGLSAEVRTVQPGTALGALVSPRAAGVAVTVLGGSVHTAAGVLEERSWWFADAPGVGESFHAGSAGARLLVLQFPTAEAGMDART